jgi:hypothetical protein
MLTALLTFLIGCLVLAGVIYVIHLMLGMLTLPPEMRQIALVIVGLIGLVVLIILAVNVFQGGGVRLWL